MKSKTIKVDYLARVEGEGAISVRVRDHHVSGVQVKIFEPPRFFEAFLRGRKFSEVPDITARICGICPVAYQMSACQAIEGAFGMEIPKQIRSLRRLLYCGEWIESHALHVYMLHAPDFLGYEDAIRMAKDHPAEVKRGLRLKKIGNQIVSLLGGREIHPVNVRVGGFYKVPSLAEFQALIEDLKWARDAALETVRWVATFSFPDFERDYEFVALKSSDEYPMNEGRLVSSNGLDIAIREYDRFFAEEHLSHSNALHSVIKKEEPISSARWHDTTSILTSYPPLAQATAREARLGAVKFAIRFEALSCVAWNLYSPATKLCVSSPTWRFLPVLQSNQRHAWLPASDARKHLVESFITDIDWMNMGLSLTRRSFPLPRRTSERWKQTSASSFRRTSTSNPTNCSGSASRLFGITIRVFRAPRTSSN